MQQNNPFGLNLYLSAMPSFRIWYFLLITIFFFPAKGQNCGITQHAFKTGEELHYKVVYNWGPMWLESAHASFRVRSAKHLGRSCYWLSGEGSTYPKYDWFFKVRDVFETWLDTATFKPLKFEAAINEGGKHDRHVYLFNQVQQKAYTIITRGNKSPRTDTVKTETCTIDVLTAIYYARSLDYSRCRINDTVGMSIIIDGKVYPIYVRYLGKAKYKTEKLGTYNCIKFSPLLVEGSIFKKGEGMTVWVSDDRNKLPLYIETPIIVGTVRVSLSSYTGLRYPETARIKTPGSE